MAAELSTGMDKAEMKALLNKASPTNPMNFAFGADKKQAAVALLVMHKTKNPKACQKLLLDDFPDAFNLRFGTLTVDADNPKKVNFQVNKAISSFAKRLTKTLKGTGFSIVEILLEDGTSVEAVSDDDDVVAVTAPGAPNAGPTLPGGPKPVNPTPAADPAALTKELGDLARQIKTVAGADTALAAKLLKFATDANVNIKTNNLIYAASTIAQLRAAIAAVPTAKPNTDGPAMADQGGEAGATGLDPDLQREWDAAWASADPKVAAAIKVSADAGKLRAVRDYALGKAESGDFVAAKKSLATLLGLIGAGPKPDPKPTAAEPTVPDGPATITPASPTVDPATDTTEAGTGTDAKRPKGAGVRLAQGMIAWNNARKHVTDQIKILQKEIIAQTADEPDAEEIKSSLGNLEEILEGLDDGLIAKLNELRGTTDPDKKAALSEQAKAEVRKMQSYANSDSLLSEIDDENGFVPLTIKSTIVKALAEVLETI